MANYLVTGGAGFIGSHIVDALVKRGGRVRVFDNLSTGKLENLSPSPFPLPLKGGEDKGEGVNLGKIEFIQGDIRDKKTVRLAVQGIDYVFQVAALRAVLRSVDDPEETHDVNVTGTL
ncbi:MAG: NAD-dependent epimerase/dehydratase family protein, partial [Candidatus Omnitrophica bacterium]|nr:NAD-dependent epimerase/dehydratase family protein [Candidatus Omnitrophota bacterium]